MKRFQQGFTLIELMIVVAIVGILAAIALPAYQDYLVRSRVSEGLARAAEAKTSVAEFVASNPTRFGSLASAGFNSAGAGQVARVSCVGTTNGACGQINVLMSATPQLAALGATNRNLVLSATSTVNGIVVWRCRPATTGGISTRFLPGSCKN